MNEFEPVSTRQMDRLVDGELSPAERRDVLTALEQDANGWRRLALAFLESQALGEGLRNKRPLVDAVGNRRPVHSELPAPTPDRKRRRWPTMLAMSLCAVVMFGLGRISMDSKLLEPPELPGPSDSKITHTQPGQPERATYQNVESIGADTTAKEIQIADTGTHQQQTLRLELGSADGSPAQTIEVPMIENSDLQPEDLLHGPPVIPEQIQRDWLRLGRRVYEQRRLYEVTLEDGRRGVVPVSDVLVENAGWDVYQ